MNFQYLETLCTVIDAGSFSVAAQKLVLSQPAVSYHIKAVERDFGGQLLDRSSIPPSLTPLGARVLPHIRQCLLSYQLARHDASTDTFRDHKRLRLGAGFSAGDYIVPMLVSEFRRACPDISISIHVYRNREILNLVMGQGCDAIITALPQLHPDYQRLRLLPLLEEKIVLAVPPRHPWTRGADIPLSRLSEEPLIMRERGSPTREVVDIAVQKAGGLELIQEIMEMASAESIKQAIRARLGVGFVSELSLLEDLAAERLATVGIRGLNITRPLLLAYVKSTPKSPALREFLNFAQSLYRQGWPQGRRRQTSPGTASGTMRLAHSSRTTDS